MKYKVVPQKLCREDGGHRLSVFYAIDNRGYSCGPFKIDRSGTRSETARVLTVHHHDNVNDDELRNILEHSLEDAHDEPQARPVANAPIQRH